MSWTNEKVEKLKELWSKGHTASQIAEALGDTTRNAVIGKAHRLNLEAEHPQNNQIRPNQKIISNLKSVVVQPLCLEKLSFNQYFWIKISKLKIQNL